MKHVTGNLLDMADAGEFDMIVHGCNIHNTFGAGIALAIKNRYPQAYEADLRTLSGDKRKLGLHTHAMAPNAASSGFIIINLYTQGRVGRSGVNVDYDAVERGFLMLKMNEIISWQAEPLRIGIPKIGAGLGGGDWERIEAIIDSLELSDITCVTLPE